MSAPKTAALTPANLASVGDVDKMLGFLMQYGTSPTAVQPKAAAKATTKRPKADGFDCLAADSKSQSTLPSYRRKAASETGSKSTGTTFAGKDMSSNRYMGKGFIVTTGCSPGPIYGAPTSIHDGPSSSFGHAERMPVDSLTREKANTPAPNKYTIPGTIVMTNPKCKRDTSFTSSKRWGPADAAPFPGPGAFHQDIMREDPTITRCSYDITFSTGARCPEKLFISRLHIADSLGAHSPGPATYTLPNPQLESGHYSVRTTRIKKDVEPRHAHLSASNLSGEESQRTIKPYVEHHSRMKAETISPGPARYSPDFTSVEKREAQPTFSKAYGHPKNLFTGKQFMVAGGESPGPQYLPPLAPRAEGKVTFADPDPNMGRLATRFMTTLYHGKGVGEVPGLVSPGPACYTPLLPSEAPAATLVWKEGIMDRPVIPGPKRARFINKEISAKENFGVYSPGPKYLLPGMFDNNKKALPGSCSFGVSDRHFVDLSPEHMAKMGTPAKPYTSPGEAKFMSVEHARMSNIGKTSPGPGNVPNDESKTTSKYKRGPAASIANRTAPEPKVEEADNEDAPPLLHPKMDICKPSLHVHKFSPTNPRTGSMFQTKKESKPGAAEYIINEISQLKHISAGRLGCLGGLMSPPKKQFSESALKRKAAEKKSLAKKKKNHAN